MSVNKEEVKETSDKGKKKREAKAGLKNVDEKTSDHSDAAIKEPKPRKRNPRGK